jgi:catechol 2,3-dioxygenase-like lactoylglutathione lyase family enzyme
VHVDQINIVVEDVAATVAFYELLGFAVPGFDSAWDAEHRTVTTPEGCDIDIDSVGFARWWGGIEGPGVVVNVRCATRPEVDERYAALVAAGHTGLKAPWDAFWGARYAVVRDPGGNAIGLMSPADPAFRSEGPEPPF